MDAVLALFTSVAIEYVFIGGIVLVSVLDSLRSGIGRTAALALALPAALFPLSRLPNALGVGAAVASPSVVIASCATFSAVLYLLFRRLGVNYLDGAGALIQAASAALALAVILVVVWLEVPALASLWMPSEPLQILFAEQFRLYWLLGAGVVLAFARA